MDVEKLIDKLRTESLYQDKCTLEIMNLCMESADTIAYLKSENARLRGDLVVAKKLIEAERKPPADLFAELSDDDKRKAEILAMRDMAAIKDKEIKRLQGWLDNIYGVLYDLDGYNPDNAKQMAGLCNDVLMMVKKAMRGEPSRISLEEAERQLKEDGKDG